jgi:glycosyltransferase involved in cell wall biosynthesis
VGVLLPGPDAYRPSRTVTVVQDYLCARAGSERVAAVMARGIPGARVFAGLYSPADTFADFLSMNIDTLPINRLGVLRRNHRRALPFLAPSFKRTFIDADICLCSTTGWSHGVQTRGRKIAYWHSPAKWLYQSERYGAAGAVSGRIALRLLRPYLIRWDKDAARTIHRHLCNSTYIASELDRIYGIRAEVLPPPHGVSETGPQTPVPGVEPGYLLSINRLLPYKKVEEVVRAATRIGNVRLVLVGVGPLEHQLRGVATDAVTLLRDVDDSSMRWLYANSIGLVTAAREDFGLTPIEAAAFGKPAAVLRYGGFTDTVVEEETGVFFDDATEVAIAGGIQRLLGRPWDSEIIRSHAELFSEERFIDRLRAIVDEECGRL